MPASEMSEMALRLSPWNAIHRIIFKAFHILVDNKYEQQQLLRVQQEDICNNGSGGGGHIVIHVL